MQRRLILGGLAILMGLALMVAGSSVYAGGWSVVTLDSDMPQVEAGVPFSFGFVVRQHGKTPMGGLAPKVEAWSSSVKERIRTTAKPEGKTGHYVATLTLPAAGEWRWQIEAFGPIATMSPLVVAAPAAKAAVVAAPAAKAASVAPSLSTGRSWLLGVGGLLLVLGVATPFFYTRRRRPGLAA